MADKGWKNNGEKVPRRSPRKRGKMINRPFKAPRAVVEERDSDIQVIEKETVADSESLVQIITETQTIGSDTTGCTPDILKSPEITHTRVPGSKKTDGIERRVNAGRKAKFKGVTYVPETEQQSTSSDSEDEVPVAQLLKTRKPGSLTLEEIQYCMEGP
jgi:hypothetical protein